MRFSSRRRTLLAASLAAAASPALGQATSSAPRVLRYAFRVAETSFDPAHITDLYSRTVAAGMFDAPLEYEFLAKPHAHAAQHGRSMPEVSDDFKTFTFRIRPASTLPTTRPSRVSSASSPPKTTSTASSATTTRAGRAATSTSWKTPRSWA
jgi:ABC-type oligopeptide transport system substrate-binding subunit